MPRPNIMHRSCPHSRNAWRPKLANTPCIRAQKRLGTFIQMMALSFAILACGALLLSLVGPQVALAVANDGHEPIVMNRDHSLSDRPQDDFYYMVDSTTGRILYCISFELHQPSQGDDLEYKGVLADVSGEDNASVPFSGAPRGKDKQARVAFIKRALDYIAYHGFSGDSSISIGSLTGNADNTDQLYLATQLAIYYVLDDTIDSQSSEPEYEPSFPTDVKEPARMLYEQAKDYANSGTDGIEARTAIWYEDTTREKCQHILTRAAKGTIHISKVSSDPDISAEDTGYSLQGAEFTVCRQDAPDTVLDRITTDENGEATTKELPYGTYVLRETKAPKGYAISQDETSVTISGGPRFVTVEETPLYALVGTILTKVDEETGKATPVGAGSLTGAQFLVSYFAGLTSVEGLPDTPTRSWLLETDENGTVSLDKGHLVAAEGGDLYLDHNGITGLPLGVVTVQEVSAPEGYLIPNEHISPTVISETMAGIYVSLVPEATVRESAVRGDVEFEKIDASSGAKMPNVVFRVTSQTTGESHLIMTDDQGHFSSQAIAHSHETNGLDSAVDERGVLDESRLYSGCGTWFYGYTPQKVSLTSKIDDSRGAFPYDSYTFEELASSSTLNHELVSFEVIVADDGQVVNKGSVKDTPVTLSTEARDGADGDKYLVAGETGQTFLDKVTYTGLTPLSEYTLTCTLVDGADGEPLKNSEGTPYTVSCVFTPQSSDGTQELSVKLADAGSLTERIVAYERLTREGKLIASHEDLNDEGQTLYIPSLSTTLTDTEDSDHTIPSETTCTLVDTVVYQGLVPGEKYQLEGILMDRDTGLALTDSAGQQLKATAPLTTTESDGTTSVSFEINTEALAGHSVVAFETITKDGKVMCTHADLNDEEQTVNIVRNFVSLPNTGSSGLPLVLSIGSVLLVLGLRLRNLFPLWKQ